jgi:hypothetical protein
VPNPAPGRPAVERGALLGLLGDLPHKNCFWPFLQVGEQTNGPPVRSTTKELMRRRIGHSTV